MSFASEFGHDIPAYDNEYDTRSDSSYSKNRSYYTFIDYSRTIELNNVKQIHSTEKALLIEYKEKQYWVPKSKISLKKETLELPYWLYEKLEAIKQTN